MHHFFVDPDALQHGQVHFGVAQAHQIARVLRMQPGDHVVVLDDSGWKYEVELLAADPGRTVGRVKSRTLAQTEARTKVTLHQALLKANKFELILQKCTELGVAAIVPTISERCVVGNIGELRAGKLDRWNRIVVEAAEQSRRGKLPVLQPVTMFPHACENARGLSIVAWEGEHERGLREVLLEALGSRTDARTEGRRPFSVNVFVGPEGGFTAGEIEMARSYGIIPVTLGRRVLRAETAALAVVTMLLYEAGDLG